MMTQDKRDQRNPFARAPLNKEYRVWIDDKEIGRYFTSSYLVAAARAMDNTDKEKAKKIVVYDVALKVLLRLYNCELELVPRIHFEDSMIERNVNPNDLRMGE